MNYPVEQLRKTKTILYELLMSAFFLCFGVNLLSTGLFELSCTLGLIKVLIGLLTCLSVVHSLTKSYLKTINRQIAIKGFVIYDEQKKQIEIVPEYLGSVVIRSGIDSGVCCDESIKKEWSSTPLVEYNNDYISQIVKEDDIFNNQRTWILNDSTYSAAVLNELLQCEMILSLARCMDIENSAKNIKTKVLDTQTAPDFLKQNRFFALFTDMENFKMNAEKGNASYSRFKACIPEKCCITISDDNEINVNDKSYELRIKSIFSRETSMGEDFLKRYLYLDDCMRYRCYSINITVVVKFKLALLLSASQSTYINWIDKYIEHLNNYYSTENFLKKIQWTSFNTIVNYMEHVNNYSSL